MRGNAAPCSGGDLLLINPRLHYDMESETCERGAGLFYVPEPFVRPLLDAGELRIVLEGWASVGGGFHLYYSSRRHVPAGIKLFIELVRELRPIGF